jgi:dTDP-4-dehydrorhamnose 3,5-epimerase
MKSKNITDIEEFKSKIFEDERGYIEINYENESLVVKKSFSVANVFRGLHIQIPPHPQSKYIWVEEGEIIDVCLNLNAESENFGKLKFINITPKNGIFSIPPYMAHGFFSIIPSKFNYICKGTYSPSNEISIKPSAKIFKKLCSENTLIISDKDRKGIEIISALEKFKDLKW